MEYIIKPKNLAQWINQSDITLIDVRSNLKNPDAGKAAYLKAHLPGAFYFHLEHDLSGKVEVHGGNHPLPDMDELANKLGEIGVNREKPVVIYDTANDMFAARLWWLLTYLGHTKTYILDGGYETWVDEGYEVTAETPIKQPAHFHVKHSPEMTVTMEEVKNRNKDKVALIDSRAKERYLGHTEPLYKKAGHIPGAVNYFWKDVLDESGNWKTTEQLRKQFSGLEKADQIIVSCGSGISACPNIVALKRAGFDNIVLYPGSYSDWISYEENPVHQGEG